MHSAGALCAGHTAVLHIADPPVGSPCAVHTAAALIVGRQVVPSTGRPDMPTVVRIDPDIPPGQPLLGPQSA
jgi:hypothetical protein